MKRSFTLNPEKKIALRFFVEAAPYKLFGLHPA